MSKFTEGTWDYVKNVDETYTVYSDRPAPGQSRSIGEVYAEGRDEAEANARLIAAAPDMYRILCAVQEQCREVDLGSDIECDIWEVLCYIEGREAKI